MRQGSRRQLLRLGEGKGVDLVAENLDLQDELKQMRSQLASYRKVGQRNIADGRAAGVFLTGVGRPTNHAIGDPESCKVSYRLTHISLYCLELRGCGPGHACLIDTFTRSR